MQFLCIFSDYKLGITFLAQSSEAYTQSSGLVKGTKIKYFTPCSYIFVEVFQRTLQEYQLGNGSSSFNFSKGTSSF